MQCQVFNSCMENPGENKFGAFTTSFTLNLYIMYNQRFLLERLLYPIGIKMNSSVTWSKPSLDPRCEYIFMNTAVKTREVKKQV